MIYRAVLTGGVGSGKTTLLNELKISFTTAVFDEVAFDIVQKELLKSDGVLPWTNPLKFCERIIKIRIDQYNQASADLSFYDRGIPDPFAFLMLDGVDPPDSLIKAASGYRYDFVFFLPPWKEIYVNRPERPQIWEYAEQLGLNLLSVYKSLGYDVVEVPKTSVKRRVDFIIKTVTSKICYE